MKLYSKEDGVLPQFPPTVECIHCGEDAVYVFGVLDIEGELAEHPTVGVYYCHQCDGLTAIFGVGGGM